MIFSKIVAEIWLKIIFSRQRNPMVYMAIADRLVTTAAQNT